MRRIAIISTVIIGTILVFLISTQKAGGEEEAEPPISGQLDKLTTTVIHTQYLNGEEKETNKDKIEEKEGEKERKSATEPKPEPQAELNTANLPPNPLNAESKLKSYIISYAEEYQVSQALVEAIIFCESRNKADAVGTAAVVGIDIGYWQINTYWHEETARAMGYDIYNPEDNLRYGFWLLATEGTKHWNASKHCWS